MLFTTDTQTLDDLHIFGKRGGDSIYQLFNRTVTRGGALVLEDMFRYPLSGEEAINTRSGIIRHFAGLGQEFPLKGIEFGAIEMYLDMTDERTRLPAGPASLNGRLSRLIGSDADYQAIVKGVGMLAALFRALHVFVAARTGESNAYEAEARDMAALLDTPGLSGLRELPVKGALSYEQVSAWDGLLRFRHRLALRQLLEYVYRLDVYVSVATVAADRGFVFPVALPREQHTIVLEGVYHPQLKKPVPNNIAITPDNNLVFLTGANMAGKSTFMKSLGVALFLAHMGFPVAASHMEFSVRDGLYTTINLPDNLGMGASHFYAEVLRVKKMAVELSQGKNLFIMFDELFRGTNVKDAFEATVAICTAFARKRNSLFVISTHIIEAGAVLGEALDNIHFVYLPTRMKGTRPVYPYTLETGITADRHGMIIIRQEGILDTLLHKAPAPGGKILQP